MCSLAVSQLRAGSAWGCGDDSSSHTLLCSCANDSATARHRLRSLATAAVVTSVSDELRPPIVYMEADAESKATDGACSDACKEFGRLGLWQGGLGELRGLERLDATLGFARRCRSSPRSTFTSRSRCDRSDSTSSALTASCDFSPWNTFPMRCAIGSSSCSTQATGAVRVRAGGHERTLAAWLAIVVTAMGAVTARGAVIVTCGGTAIGAGTATDVDHCGGTCVFRHSGWRASPGAGAAHHSYGAAALHMPGERCRLRTSLPGGDGQGADAGDPAAAGPVLCRCFGMAGR